MAKFIPGEWKIEITEDRYFLVNNNSRGVICDSISSEQTFEVDMANAQLISKAPEMYGLLNRILPIVEQYEDDNKSHNFMYTKAINKLLEEIDGE